jgi:hypothetical protein
VPGGGLMIYVLYTISGLLLGISIFLYMKGKMSAKKYMLRALDVAILAAKITTWKGDDELFAMLKQAIEESDDASVEKVMEKIRKED